MKKPEQIKYKKAITWGRFQIIHPGHIQLVQQCLNYGEYADVHLSGATKNNDFDLRVLMLRHMCKEAGVDLSRVKFLRSKNISEAMKVSVGNAPYNEAVLVLGSDQTDMGYTFSEMYDTAFVINRRSGSSTMVRHFLDCTNFFEDAVCLYNGDSFAASLALVLRHEETSNVKVGAA